jgi:hypothetical protein
MIFSNSLEKQRIDEHVDQRTETSFAILSVLCVSRGIIIKYIITVDAEK